LVKTIKELENKSLKDLTAAEIEKYSKNCLDCLKLLQSRYEKFSINDNEGMELDEIDEILFDIKEKIQKFEENQSFFHFKYTKNELYIY
jgi:hypothetical protein